MGDLMLQKWDSVIVDWVNCLEIAKRIQSINALKSGDFFNALLDLLQPDLPTTVGDFLRTYYPKFELGSGGNVEDVGQLTDPELTAAASMLLHFMCLHIRRDELIAPMCQKLTGNVQTYIKHFLEHFSEDTVATQFNDVIHKVIGSEHTQHLTVCTPTKRAMEWNSSGESPFAHNSPLMEFLKTPAARSAKMQEKDKEIRRLAQELQMERDEKEDLNVELKEQKKRVQKIVSEVQEKSRIISNLSARLTELEEKPPTNKPKELIEIEKVLRSELADAQQFIAELQSEQEEFTLKNDEISKKLTSAEESICMWQARALQFESKLEDTVTKSKAQEHELLNLQINYTELSTLLDELRQTKSNNCTLELDNSVSTVNIESKVSAEETLADTVVEIQLKECQLEIQKLHSQLLEQVQHSSDADDKLRVTLKELDDCRLSFSNLESLKHDVDVTLDKYILTNEKMEAQINKLAKEHEELCVRNAILQDSLNESIDQSQKLEDELSDVKGKLGDVNNNHQQLEIRHSQLIEDLEKLKKSEENLSKVNIEYRQHIEALTQEILGKDQDIVTIKSHLLEREEVIAKNEDLVWYLRRNLEEVERKRDHFKEKLNSKDQMYQVLEEESRQLQHRYEETIEIYNTTDFNLNALRDQIKNSDTQFQVCIDRLDELITGSINITKLEKLDRLEGLLDKLESKQMAFENTIDTLNAVNCKLEESFNMLQLEDVTTKETLENVQQCLDQTKETVKSLEGGIQEKICHINELENRLNSLNITIRELENMKEFLSKKEFENLELSEQNETLTLSLKESSCKLIAFEQLQTDLTEKVSLLSIESCERLHKAKELERHLSDAKLTAEGLEEVKISLQNEVESAKLFGEAQKKQHDDLLQRFLALQDDFLTIRSENSSLGDEVINLGKLKSELLLQIKELQSTIKQRTEHTEDLLQKIEELKSTKDKEQLVANDTINNLQVQLDDVKRVVDMKSAAIKNMQEAIEDQNRKKQELEQKCADIQLGKKQLEEKSSYRIETLEEDVNKLQDDLNSCQEDISSRSTEINELQTKLGTAIEDMQKIVEEKKDLEQKCAEIELEKQQITENLLLQIESLQTDINKLQVDLKSCEMDISSRQAMIDELKLLADKKSAAVSTLQNKLIATIADMEKTIGEHKQSKEDLEQKCMEIQHEKQQLEENSSLKIEILQGDVNKLEEMLKTCHEDLSLKESKIVELHLLGNEKSAAVSTLEDKLSATIADMEKTITEHNQRKEGLERKCMEIQLEKQELEENCSLKIETLQRDINKFEEMLKTCHDDISLKESKIVELQLLDNDKSAAVSTLRDKLTATIADKDKTIDDHNRRKEELERKCMETQLEKQQLEENSSLKIKILQEDVNKLEEMLKTCYGDISSKESEIVKLHSLVDEKSSAVNILQNRLTATIADMDKTIDEHNQKKEELEQKCMEIQLEKQQLEENSSLKIKILQEDVNKLEEMLKTCHGDISVKESEIVKLHSLVDEKSSAVNILQNRLTATIADMDKTIDEHNRKKEELEQKCMEIQLEKQQLEGNSSIKIKILQEDVNKLEEVLRTCHGDISSKESEIVELHSLVDEKSSAVNILQNRLTATIADTDKTIDEHNRKKEELEQKCMEIQLEKQQLEGNSSLKIKILQEDVNKLEEVLKTCHGDISSKESEIVELHSLVDEKASAVNILQNRLTATIADMDKTIDEHNRKKEELEQKCMEIQLEKQQLEGSSSLNIKILQGDINKLEEMLKTCHGDISSKESTIVELHSLLDEKSSAVSTLQNKLTATIADMDKTIAEHNQRKEDLEHKFMEIQLEKQQFEENSLFRIEILQSDVKKLEEMLKTCREDNSLKESKIVELQLLDNDKSAALSTLQNKLTATIADMEKTIGEHNQSKEELEQKCMEMQLEKQQLEENSSLRIEILQGDVNKLEEILKTCYEDISSKESKIIELHLLIDEKSSITDTLQEQLVQVKEERKVFEKITGEKLTSLGMELDGLRAEIMHLNNDNNSKLKSIEELQISMDQQNYRYKELEEASKKLLEDSQKEVKTLNGSVNKMDLELTISQKKVNIQLQLIEELRMSIEKQEHKIQDLNKQVEGLDMERAIIMKEAAEKIDTLEKEIGTLLQNLASNDIEIAKLRETLNQLNSDFDILLDKCTGLENNKKDIENESKKRIKFLEEENALNKKTISELIDEIDSQLHKLTSKDFELTTAKEAFSNKDLASMQSINELNNRLNILTDIKVKMETDLRIAKDEIGLKVKELEDMDKSKAHLEKQLTKTIQQHENKRELMQLTIDNLETKVMALSDEKASVESDFERETLKLLEVSNEKNKVFEEMRLLKDDLSHIKKQLKEKEAECNSQDDILEKNTVELLSLKLDIEMKSHEISTLKTTANNLENDKFHTIKLLNDSKDEIKRMSLEHQTTLDELKVVNNIKVSLKEKMDYFKDIMQDVFAHFEIKKRNMKQSLEDLMQYKISKDAEIKQLNSQLIETRADLENQREENDSIRRDMQNTINTKQREVKLLENEIDALRITEAGFLQDIANLKEELNDTIDKYTAALAAEKDQKAESDVQIQGLTESLHEMVTKYNILDGEYKELTNVLDYNNKSFEELKRDKDSLALDIVRLRNDYEDDAKNCKAEFQAELKTLKKIEDALHKDIEDLNNQLQQSQEEGNTVLQELHDAKSHLHIIQCEKAELTNKLDQMDLENTTLMKEYESLKIAKEEFMKESKASLIRKQDLLQETKKSCEAIIAQKDKDIVKLKKEVSKCTDRLKKEEDTFKKDMLKKDKEMGELHNSIANFLQNIETLTKERDGLKKKLEQHQNLVAFSKEQEETIASHLKQIQNLKVSVDVLEAGKSKMEKMQADLENRLTMLQKQAHDEHSYFEETKSALQSQLDKTSVQLKESELLIKDKVAEIEAANEEFDSVQAILTNMSKKMEASSRQLTVIHEDYEGKLKAERASFEELKRQYETTVKEMQYMSGLNGDLHVELQEAQRERLAAEETLRVKEDMISELQHKYDSVASVVDDKDAALASLQAQLAAGLERLAAAANARQCVEGELRRASTQLAQVEAQKEELVEQHAGALSMVEESLLCTEKEIKQIVNNLCAAQYGREEVERMLTLERDAKGFLERRVVDLEIQVQEAIGVKNKLKENIRRLNAIVYEWNEKDVVGNEEDLDEIIMETERKLIIIIGKLRDLEALQEVAKQDKENVQSALRQMEKCNKQLSAEKEKLIANYEKLHEEKAALLQDKAKDSKSLENMKTQYEALKERASSSTLMAEKLLHLEHHNKVQHDLYTEFTQKSQEIFKVIEFMISDRNSIEQIVHNLKDQLTTLQIKSIHVTEDTHKLHYEQKIALEIIIDDIYKQFRRLSKMIYNLNLKCHQTVERTIAAIMDDKPVAFQPIFKELSGDEIVEKLEDLKDNAKNTQVQLEQFLQAIEILSTKEEKPTVLKENWQPCKQPKDDEWRRKYLSNKQKLTLVENAKNNFEKKIKQLREEIINLQAGGDAVKIEVDIKKESRVGENNIVKPVQSALDTDVHYKKLLQEFIQLKQKHQQEIQVWGDKCQQLETQISTLQRIQAGNSKDDSGSNEGLETELSSLRLSYRDVKIAYSKLQLDYSALEQLLHDRNEQLTALSLTKDSYSTLCEENTKLQSEIDTLKYKRQRDREQFLQHIKKLDAELADKVTAIRGEYDLKVEKMKEKIVAKYREQMDQNAHSRYEKIIALKEENDHIKDTVDTLKDELVKAQAKNDVLDTEKQYALQQLRVARSTREELDFNKFKEPAALSRRASSHSLQSELRSAIVEERRSTFSLPRNIAPSQQVPTHGQMDIIEEVRYRRRTSNVASSVSPTELQMEDEGDMFNNKYLHDLKEGRPSIAGNGHESHSSRLSEFAYRNSLCPPHLKSSYPAETQFLDHKQFKEDDLKSGNLDFGDDTMKTYLLPSEKPKKKDAGTTSYKKPGPPTPSKHGGRLSLQGSERVLREIDTDQKQQRQSANPLRGLFSSSKSKIAASDSGGAIGENTGTSPKKRSSLSFFRR